MIKTPNSKRDKLYKEVLYGRVTPDEAEKLAKTRGFEAFAKTPDPLVFDAGRESKWTLPMAAAWFIWRSLAAVRDQWNDARSGWSIWISNPPWQSPHPKPKPGWTLKTFGPASLADVLAQVGLGHQHSGSSPTTNPRARLKDALISGKLIATREHSKGEKKALSSEYWRRHFEKWVRAPSNAKGIIIDGEPYQECLDQTFVDSDRVIEIEQEISRSEYEGADWSLGQALGWFAYGDETNFRSLWAADLKPAPTYYGKSYASDFAIKDPALALKEVLIEHKLMGHRGGEIAASEWLQMDVWDCPDVKFRRADVLKVRKRMYPAQKKRVSQERVRQRYLEVQAQNGGQIGLNRWFEIAKRDDITRAQARDIHRELDPTFDIPGRKTSLSKPPKIPE
jgi:hypothetical protein